MFIRSFENNIGNFTIVELYAIAADSITYSTENVRHILLPLLAWIFLKPNLYDIIYGRV